MLTLVEPLNLSDGSSSTIYESGGGETVQWLGWGKGTCVAFHLCPNLGDAVTIKRERTEHAPEKNNTLPTDMLSLLLLLFPCKLWSAGWAVNVGGETTHTLRTHSLATESHTSTSQAYPPFPTLILFWAHFRQSMHRFHR